MCVCVCVYLHMSAGDARSLVLVAAVAVTRSAGASGVGGWRQGYEATAQGLGEPSILPRDGLTRNSGGLPR